MIAKTATAFGKEPARFPGLVSGRNCRIKHYSRELRRNTFFNSLLSRPAMLKLSCLLSSVYIQTGLICPLGYFNEN